MIKKVKRCPVNPDKKDCPLFDQSTSGRCWCDNENDPDDFERCPIPNKRKTEMNKN